MFPENLHDKGKHLLMILIPPSKSEGYTFFSVLNSWGRKKKKKGKRLNFVLICRRPLTTNYHHIIPLISYSEEKKAYIICSAIVIVYLFIFWEYAVIQYIYLHLPIHTSSVDPKKVACLFCFTTAEKCHLTYMQEYRVTSVIDCIYRATYHTPSLFVNT